MSGHPPTTQDAAGRLIDLRHLGRERVIGCWEIGDVLVDPGPTSCLAVLLEALGDRRPRALALTHIHLDHAGASGSLVERWPDLEVWVHERGARHLAHPEKLMASAARLYGDDMQRRWGEMRPVPEENLRILSGGERLGPFAVAYTPGHASHHVAYLHGDSGRAFTGDAAGVRIAPSDYVLAPTPPPDIDVEAWHRSLDLIAGWDPTSVAVTHFGAFDDVGAHLDGVREWLGRWAPHARDHESGRFESDLRAEIAAATDPDTAAAFEQAAPPDQLAQGLRRYWDTRESDR